MHSIRGNPRKKLTYCISCRKRIFALTAVPTQRTRQAATSGDIFGAVSPSGVVQLPCSASAQCGHTDGRSCEYLEEGRCLQILLIPSLPSPAGHARRAHAVQFHVLRWLRAESTLLDAATSPSSPHVQRVHISDILQRLLTHTSPFACLLQQLATSLHAVHTRQQ